MDQIYIAKNKITYEMASHLTDEQIKRQLVHHIIEGMPLNDLSKIFKFEVLNPISNESQILLSNPHTPELEKERIRINRETFTLEYEASIRVSEYQEN
jgi:hypothetical protein